ncbi:MAG: peptidylprolyl isomerase [Oscillospiraceae bacterium]|nr:peptidylprolyl isomerase [Oscillospiraceae bacterium]
MLKRILPFFMISVVVVSLFTGCKAKMGFLQKRSTVESEELQFVTPKEGDTIATIDTSLGTIICVLYPQYAPKAVENFINLSQKGYYNGLTFHRVVSDFIIQSGDPTATGSGGESYWGVPFENEFTDKLHHYAGALSMSNRDSENVSGTNTSQFFIVACPQNSVPDTLTTKMLDAGWRDAVIKAYQAAGGAPYLDNLNTVFGQVIKGMDIVDKIAAVEVDENDKPVEDVVVSTITIGTFTANILEENDK